MSEALPLFLVSAMGLSLLLYVILDGFDLGVGMLLRLIYDLEQGAFLVTFPIFSSSHDTLVVIFP